MARKIRQNHEEFLSERNEYLNTIRINQDAKLEFVFQSDGISTKTHIGGTQMTKAALLDILEELIFAFPPELRAMLIMRIANRMEPTGTPGMMYRMDLAKLPDGDLPERLKIVFDRATMTVETVASTVTFHEIDHKEVGNE